VSELATLQVRLPSVGGFFTKVQSESGRNSGYTVAKVNSGPLRLIWWPWSCLLLCGRRTRSSLPPTGQTGAAAACLHLAALRPDAFLPQRVFRQLLASAAAVSSGQLAALRPYAFLPGRVHRHPLAGAHFGKTGPNYAACQLVNAQRPDAISPGRVLRHLVGSVHIGQIGQNSAACQHVAALRLN
jgi:hypothetical protein